MLDANFNIGFAHFEFRELLCQESVFFGRKIEADLARVDQFAKMFAKFFVGQTTYLGYVFGGLFSGGTIQRVVLCLLPFLAPR